MSIECYFHQCSHHSSHYDMDNGPFCDERECIATDEQIAEYAVLREQRLAVHVYKKVPASNE